MTTPAWNEPLRQICRDVCAFYGEPPCWRLPELVEPCEPIEPCDECVRDWKERIEHA